MGNLIFNSKDSMQNLIKLVNEAAEAVGKVFGGGKGTGAFVLAAPVAALIVSGVADYIDDKQQKQIQCPCLQIRLLPCISIDFVQIGH